MFSSFTSFLPTSLRDTQRTTPPVQQEEEQPRPGVIKPLSESAEEAEPQPSQKRQRERERRHANEIFVIVRPPPSKSNHPLNLQVQLVPPYSKAALPRSSTEFEPSQSTLYRSPSNQSQESSTTYGSTASFTSTGSGASTATSSTSSTRRAIVPLYNLQAHNVLPNVIVDAGTEGKVAKFQKRGIEFVNLALLEPVEVWTDPNAVVMPVAVSATTLSVPIVGPEASTSTLGRLSVDEMGFAQIHTRTGTATGRSVAAFLAAPPGSSSRPTTPEAPAVMTAASSSSSLPSASHRVDKTKNSEFPAKQEPHYAPPASDVLSPNGGKRNIFGRIFKKNGKEASSAESPPLTPSPSALSNANKHQPLPAYSQSPVRKESKDSPDVPNSQNHTPTQLQHTPTSHLHPYLGSKAVPASAGGKRASGVRGSWLLGSPSAIKSPSQPPQSPLAAAFSSLGMKRRPILHPGQEGEGSLSINLNEAQDEIAVSSQPTSAHILTSVPQSNQAQPQLSQSVLGVQPTLCVVPYSAVTASRGYRRYQSRSPDDEASRSVERADANGFANGGKQDKDDKRGKVLRRVYMYVWLARKWIKRRPSPPQQENHTRFGIGLPIGSSKGPGLDTTWVYPFKGHELGIEEMVEVRFEWKRGSIGTNVKKKQNDVSNVDGAATGAEEDAEYRKKRNEGRRSHSRQREEPKAARRDESIDVGSAERNRKHSASSISSARAAVKRWSLLSHQSRSTGGASEDGDDGADPSDESDPEDSETPWVCTLKLRRTNIAAAKEVGANLTPSHTPSYSTGGRGRNKGGADGDGNEDKHQLKIKVGTLSPTPHHPKVVAMLKLLYPLPDAQIERLQLVNRGPLPQSGAVPHEKVDDYYGLTLTGEEIKDIVCSTSLWLIVRENIGGVGKVQRKGDGWMIRS